MTPQQARQHGKEWGRCIALAELAGIVETARVYRERRVKQAEAYSDVTLMIAQDAGYWAEYRRVKGETG